MLVIGVIFFLEILSVSSVWHPEIENVIVTANTCADGGTVARTFPSVFVHVSTAAGARDQASIQITGDMTASGRVSSQQRPDTAQVREPVLAVEAELGLGDLVAVELGL